ncbi:MAG: 4Fe-4S dicluster domain-containing protein [Myxococcota bacterium]
MSNESSKSSRRGFFRASIRRLREGALEAAREFADAGSVMADSVTGLDPDPPAARARPHRRASPGRSMVRPPGALPEIDFLSTCERCAKCVEACPEDAILQAGTQYGVRSEGTPMLQPDRTPCVMCADVPCASACPSGALKPIPAEAIRIGEALVMGNLCLNRRGEACEACIDACPYPDEAIRAGEGGVPVVSGDACTGCGLCASSCPAYPKAIAIRPL